MKNIAVFLYPMGYFWYSHIIPVRNSVAHYKEKLTYGLCPYIIAFITYPATKPTVQEKIITSATRTA